MKDHAKGDQLRYPGDINHQQSRWLFGTNNIINPKKSANDFVNDNVILAQRKHLQASYDIFNEYKIKTRIHELGQCTLRKYRALTKCNFSL